MTKIDSSLWFCFYYLPQSIEIPTLYTLLCGDLVLEFTQDNGFIDIDSLFHDSSL